jgi:endonuclease/exonuclease/phosphatase family metal-dependent hydrolase
VTDYSLLDSIPEPDRQRTIAGLQRLRAALRQQVPPKTLDATMLLATWNIRELDTSKGGWRSTEAYLYLAEVLRHFDLVGIQEVREDLAGLDALMTALGTHWQSIVTDITEGRPGNGERMACVYDSRTVEFAGIASQLVLPPLSDGTPAEQVARTPLMAGFRSGDTAFQVATVHVIYGTDDANDPRRVDEIGDIACALRRRAHNEHAWSHDLVLLGDFNIFSPQDQTMAALTDQGWVVPPELQSIPGSNVPKNKHYDQIALRDPQERLDRFETTGRAGVFDVFECVYRLQDEPCYAAQMGQAYQATKDGRARTDAEREAFYRDWRTYQISDHLPMWLELRTDYHDELLLAAPLLSGSSTA